MQSRADHLAWCKRRALDYLPDSPVDAFASMTSDLGKHPELADHVGISLGADLLLSGLLSRPEDMRNWIEGFN